MKIVPVIDILNGITVHAIKGNRGQYKPLQSNLTKSTNPLEVAKTFKTSGFNQLYIADLDAIIDCTSGFDVFKQIVEKSGLELMVDAGITNIERAKSLFQTGVQQLIIGTETLQNKTFVAQALKQFGSNHVLLSLDLKGDKVLVGKDFDGSTEPLKLLSEFKTMGLSQVIVLDLSRVGSGDGVDYAFLKQVQDIGLDVYVGGGIRGIADLVELKKLGISGALIATSLHSGKIDVAELRCEDLL